MKSRIVIRSGGRTSSSNESYRCGADVVIDGEWCSLDDLDVGGAVIKRDQDAVWRVDSLTTPVVRAAAHGRQQDSVGQMDPSHGQMREMNPIVPGSVQPGVFQGYFDARR